MQVHFDNFALNLNLHILNCVYENNFHSKSNKNVEINSLMDVHLKT